MTVKITFPAALKTLRKLRGLSQEAFADFSSRTYVSSLERGLQSPTLKKIGELCEVIQIHPLTLLTMAYAGSGVGAAERLLARVQRELAEVDAATLKK